MLNRGQRKADAIKVMLATLFISPFLYLMATLYTGGDQVHYTQVYNLISERALIESYLIYRNNLNSSELGHFFLSWWASGLISKELFGTILNVLLLIYGVLSLTKLTNRSAFLVLSLLLINYYIWVLMFSAERLKVAFIFLFASLYYYDRMRVKLSFLAMALLSHVSIVLLIFASFAPTLSGNIVRTIRTGRLSISTVGYLAVGFSATTLLASQVIIKLTSYFNDYFDFFNITKIMLLLGFVLFFIRRERRSYISVMCFLAVAALFVGDDRVNIFAFLYTQYHFLLYERVFSSPFILMSAYLFAKTVIFINMVITYGDAFFVAV